MVSVDVLGHASCMGTGRKGRERYGEGGYGRDQVHALVREGTRSMYSMVVTMGHK